MVSPSPVPTLLLLDDDPGVLKVLSHLGGRAGFDVSTYEDPAGALDAVRQSAPDVAMIDLRLPRMGGLTVISEIKRSAFVSGSVRRTSTCTVVPGRSLAIIV